MRHYQICTLAALFMGLTLTATAGGQTLVWSDEFDGPDVDRSKWTYNTGGSGFGNGELQYYTARPENVFIDNGSLVIEARRENYLGGKEFTSSRLLTNGRFSFKYGTVEARIKLPNADNGLWPAFWIMGTSHGYWDWPKCGELDIMEFGRKDGFDAGVINQRVVSAAHWEYAEEHAVHHLFTDRPTLLYNDYHLFKMEWTPLHIKTYVDNDEFWSIDISEPVADDLEEFHTPVFIITNIAVGGWNFVEITDPALITATFPARMYIDYVRLYDNGDTELYYGDDAQETGDFGVFTETTPVNNGVVYDVDAELNVWNNLTSVTDVAYEGTEVWSMTTTTGDWWGMGAICKPLDRNLKNYSDGHMHLHMKTTSTETFKIGIESSTSGQSWVHLVDGGDTFGLVRDGDWHEVIIPLNSFLNIDFNTVSQLFVIAGDPPSSTVEFAIDNIYWTPDVARPTPENGSFGIFTEDAVHKTAGDYQLGVDGNFFIWANTLLEGTQTPYEGAASMAYYSAPGLNWFGAAFTPTIKYNLSAFRFPESKLHLALKTSSTTTFRLGMRSGNVDDIGQKWIEFASGSDPYGFVRDGNWHVVEIPMADIIDAVDLTEVSMLFELLGVNGPITDIEFDDVCLLGGGEALVVGAGYPIADAGDDQVIVLPTSSAVANGSGSHDNGTIVDFAWQQMSGPSTAILSGADTAVLTASSLVEGVYVFRLTVTDDDTLTDIDDVSVTVTTPEPTAYAGDDQSIVLPENSVTLAGSGSDADGVIVAYDWTQVSGPTTAVLTDADTATATAGNLYEGTYVFELTVTDDSALTGSDQVSVEVIYQAVNIALGKPATVSSSTGSSLVTNGGFESGTGTEADGWSLLEYTGGSSTAIAERVSMVPYEGTWHVDLNVVGAADGGPAALAQQQTPTGSVIPGTAYDLEVQARRIGSFGPGIVAELSIQWLDSDGSHGGGVKGSTGNLPIQGTLTESYAPLGFTGAVAAAGSDAALIVLRLAGGAIAGSNGEVAADDVSLTSAETHTADHAVDGDPGTRWASSDGDPQWIEIALGDRYEITQVVLDWAAASGQEYDIDVSDDGVLWSTAYSTTTGTGGTETIDFLAIGQFIRLYSHVGNTTNGCSLYEFEAYGSVSFPAGDMDENGLVELADLPHFVDALLGNPPAEPYVDQGNADMDGDDQRNGDDIQPFVDALIP